VAAGGYDGCLISVDLRSIIDERREWEILIDAHVLGIEWLIWILSLARSVRRLFCLSQRFLTTRLILMLVVNMVVPIVMHVLSRDSPGTRKGEGNLLMLRSMRQFCCRTRLERRKLAEYGSVEYVIPTNRSRRNTRLREDVLKFCQDMAGPLLYRQNLFLFLEI